jgi:hypothetical protein
MERMVLALIALRKEFRPLQKPSAEPEFKSFDVSSLARRYGVEDLVQDQLMLPANIEVCL